jgi:hypothetical protein
MLTTLQTLIFLFATAFIIGFLSRDIKSIFNQPTPAVEGASTAISDGQPVATHTPTPQPPQ